MHITLYYKKGRVIIMSKTLVAKNSYYILEVEQSKNRVYMTLMGQWSSLENVKDYIYDVKKCIEEVHSGFTLLVDVTQYIGISPEIYNIHVESLKLAVEAKLSRIAEVFFNNELLKIVFEGYAKESGAIVMTFKNTLQAEKWLDLY
jgi:hypothetical protein